MLGNPALSRKSSVGRMSSKHRTWHKFHLGVNEAMGEIITAVATTNDVSEDQLFDNLLYQIQSMICHFVQILLTLLPFAFYLTLFINLLYKLDLLLDGV